MDKREALRSGSILEVYREKGETGSPVRFLVGEEINRGGSCIVYEASYADSVGIRHPVRLKESYPYGLRLSRDDKGRLCPGDGQIPRFRERQRQFIESYKKQVEIRQETGLSNITIGTFQLYYGNGTVYSVMDCSEGTDYRKLGKENLKETLQRVRAVAFALWKYHQAGYLHLDIKPENVWLIPETRELAQLFDFDSIVKQEDLKERDLGAQFFIFTEGFAAPELTQKNGKKIGPVTDIYGLGALLFSKLTGRCPARQDRERGVSYDFTELKRENESVRPLFFQRLEGIFPQDPGSGGGTALSDHGGDNQGSGAADRTGRYRDRLRHIQFFLPSGLFCGERAGTERDRRASGSKASSVPPRNRRNRQDGAGYEVRL